MADDEEQRGGDGQPWETERETSGSGQPVYRYEERLRDFEPAIGDSSLIEAVERHITEHLPGESSVLHEILSDLVHVDVHVVKPTNDRPYYTLVTSGMSERPMTQPPGVEGCQFAELMICLPPDWPGFDSDLLTTDEAHPWRDPSAYWPIGWLKQLARFPHEYDTWIWYGHTIPHGDPAEPYAPDTGLSSILLLPPVTLPESFHVLDVGDREVHFFALVPLHADELQLKLDQGTDALFPHFEAAGVDEVLNPHRPSVLAGGGAAGKPWWKFW